MTEIEIELKTGYSVGRFSAMACPCEILIESLDKPHVKTITLLAFEEARRIETKFSRYRSDNIIHKINTSNGHPIIVDEETALMINFANHCYELSEGKFDITSGVLRRAWKFDGSDKIPDKEIVKDILKQVGWKKIEWNYPQITLADDMEIDLGGIGKEYAVDSTSKILQQHTDASFLVNYGGDISCPKPRNNNTPWMIGVDNPSDTSDQAAGKIALYRGGLATSGDARRFLLKDNIRYSHILNPLTGFPVTGAPRSVSVIANTCLEAGMLSTFAMLEGENATEFLRAQEVEYWVIP